MISDHHFECILLGSHVCIIPIKSLIQSAKREIQVRRPFFPGHYPMHLRLRMAPLFQKLLSLTSNFERSPDSLRSSIQTSSTHSLSHFWHIYTGMKEMEGAFHSQRSSLLYEEVPIQEAATEDKDDAKMLSSSMGTSTSVSGKIRGGENAAQDKMESHELVLR